MEIDVISRQFYVTINWSSIDQYQLTNWYRLILIDQLVFWWSIFIHCVCRVQDKTRLAQSPVHSGRLEYICWHSIYPVHWCTMGHGNFWLFVISNSWYLIRLLLALCQLVARSLEVNDYWTFCHCFNKISFCSRVYMYVRGMCYITSRQNAQWSQRMRS